MFQKAERRKVHLKIALTGPSGAGKTYSALMLARGLGKKVALVDTENGSASLYADRFEFDTVTMSPPYTTTKYIQAINEAIKLGYDVLVLDSLSHAWAGDGGILARKEQLDAGGGGSKSGYANWAKFSKEHEQFKAAILNAGIHIVASMRSKTEYALVEERGKQVPKKVGMAPVQRDGMEYEFTTVFDLDITHHATVSKDRTGLFAEQPPFVINDKAGQDFMAWLASAKPAAEPVSSVLSGVPSSAKPAPAAQPAPQQNAPISNPGAPTQDQLKRLYTVVSKRAELGWTHDRVKLVMAKLFKIDTSKALTLKQYDELVNTIQTKGWTSVAMSLELDPNAGASAIKSGGTVVPEPQMPYDQGPMFNEEELK